MEYSTLKDFIDQKLSIRQILKLTNKSYTTIRYWLKQHNLKTHYKSFKEEVYVNDNKHTIKRDNGNPIQKCNSCGIDLNVETGYWRKKDNYGHPTVKNALIKNL